MWLIISYLNILIASKFDLTAKNTTIANESLFRRNYRKNR